MQGFYAWKTFLRSSASELSDSLIRVIRCARISLAVLVN